MVAMNTCREFQGTRTDKGYGVLYRNGKTVFVHRHVWEMIEGPLEEDECVLHKCDNPPCFLHEHLFKGTKKTNAQDREKKKRGYNSRKTHCPKGHPYSHRNSEGNRVCFICIAERTAYWNEKRKNKGGGSD